MSKLPEPRRTLSGEIRKDRARERRRDNSSPFFGTGMHPNGEGGLDSDNFDATHGFSFKGDTGDAEFNGNVDIGGTANVGGTLNVTGNTVIGGTLSLPAGIIDNDALANPVVPGQAFQGASTFALSVAGGNIITITRTVPAGFTSVVVNAYGRVAAINSTANKDALYSAVDVNGTGGNQFGNEVAAGDFGSISAGYSTLLTGLTSGASIATHLYASTGLAGWASDPANGGDLSVTYLWFR